MYHLTQGVENQYQCNQNVCTTLFIVLPLHREPLLLNLFDETVDIFVCINRADVLMWHLDNTCNLEGEFFS